MTLLEFITDLQSKGFTDKEVFDQAQEFKKTQTPVEEVVVEETETVKEGNSNDLPPTDADVDLENAASENTELELASGSSESVDDFNISTFQDSQRSGLTLGDLNARLKPEEENREAIKNYEKMTLVAEPEESYTEGAYDYKYNFTEDGATYYAKEKGAENWEITEQDSDSYLNIQSLFGHNSLDREKFASSQNLLKGGGDLNNLYNELKGQSSDIDNIKDEPIDPRLDYVQQIYNDQILVGKEELKDINKAATEFTVDVPEEIPEMEYDTTYAKEVPTGKIIIKYDTSQPRSLLSRKLAQSLKTCFKCNNSNIAFVNLCIPSMYGFSYIKWHFDTSKDVKDDCILGQDYLMDRNTRPLTLYRIMNLAAKRDVYHQKRTI